MTSSVTEEYNTGAFHSHATLVNPHKERGIERICQSEPFIKPIMTLHVVRSKTLRILPHFTFKVPAFFRDKKSIVPQYLHRMTKKVQSPITGNSKRTLLQKNKAEGVSREQTAEKAGDSKISKEEWEKITRSSAKVILDPNTANPTLKLSVDGRSVRTKTFKEFQSSQSFHEYQRKYNQYNAWTCVQAQEGYSTGTHYWEVDVKGKCDWRVGVVKESAQRNGFIKLNTTTGYWTLRLQLGSLMALTEPVTKLNQAPPSKIGVHLNLEEGMVSFYDAMKRKHIYTFKAEFRNCEKMYPVFGTVETDKPLKIT